MAEKHRFMKFFTYVCINSSRHNFTISGTFRFVNIILNPNYSSQKKAKNLVNVVCEQPLMPELHVSETDVIYSNNVNSPPLTFKVAKNYVRLVETV